MVVAVRAAMMAGLLLVFGCGRILGPRATLGPGSIVRGRGLYNEVITYTNNEQTLDVIVRARYGEPSGLLSVASVTASLKSAATTQAQFGIGPSSHFQGNLVPLSAGLAYEENPTISYTPVQGERYAKNMLSPLGLDVLVLLLNTERVSPRILSVLVRQVNGLRNSMTAPPAARAAFEDSVGMLARLQDAGQAAWTSTAGSPDAIALVIHGYAPGNLEAVRELLRMWELPESLTRQGRDIVLPVKLAFGRAPTPRLNVQTRSVYDLLQIAAAGVEVPAEDVELGLPDVGFDALSPPDGFLKIRSARSRPSSNVLVAVLHRGWWFYIPANDGPSKFSFRLLQTLITMRLAEAAPQTAPTLTIPVGR
jgi:hypothetical protein